MQTQFQTTSNQIPYSEAILSLLNINSKTKNENKYNVAIVTSLFNLEITKKLQEGALKRLTSSTEIRNIFSVEVPGAYEIPLAASWLLEKENIDAVIALGAVIRGETSHYDFVCNSVERGCTELQLNYGKPVVFGVLTTENEEQALDRVGGKHGHKGEEAANVAIDMLIIKNKIREI